MTLKELIKKWEERQKDFIKAADLHESGGNFHAAHLRQGDAEMAKHFIEDLKKLEESK
jgi:hypothetical protein